MILNENELENQLRNMTRVLRSIDLVIIFQSFNFFSLGEMKLGSKTFASPI